MLSSNLVARHVQWLSRTSNLTLVSQCYLRWVTWYVKAHHVQSQLPTAVTRT